MDNKKKTFLPALAAALGNIIWGLSFLFTKVGLALTDPNVVLAHRFTVSTLLMLVTNRICGQKMSLKEKNWKPAILLMILQQAYYVLETYGVLYTNATIAGLVLATVPVVAIATGALFLKEYPTLRQGLFCLLSVIGVILMTAAGSDLGVIRPIGMILLAATCLSSAGYKTANRKASRDFTSVERTFLVLASSALFFNITAIGSVKGDMGAYIAPFREDGYLLAILGLSVFCSIAANILVNYAAANMSVFKVSSFGALSTLTSTVTGVLILKEPMNLVLLIGAVLILAGIREVTKNKTA